MDEGGNGGDSRNSFANLFGGGKKKEMNMGEGGAVQQQLAKEPEKPKKNGFVWPF